MKNFEKIQRENKGITLIALIITVIILLILAGTAIAISVNGGDLFGKASEARDTWNEAVAKENTEINNYYTLLNSFSGTRLVDMYKNGLECDKDYLTCTDETHLHIGDYVTYTPSRTDRTVTLGMEQTGVEGTQIFKYDDSVTWRVLGLNEAGTNVLLVAGSPLRKDKQNSTAKITTGDVSSFLALMGAEGFAWTNDEYITAGYIDENILDKISRIYSNEMLADDVRSIRMADLYNALDLVEDGAHLYKKSDLTTDLMYYSTVGLEYTYQDGDYAPENYLKYRYPERFAGLTNKVIGDKVQGTDHDFMYTSSDIVDSSSIIYELLFKDTVGDDENWEYAGPKAYWLGDSKVFARANNCVFGAGAVAFGDVEDCMYLFGKNGLRGEEYGVKPVVCLKSTVTDEQVKITTGSEPTWTENSGNVSFIWWDEEVFVGAE